MTAALRYSDLVIVTTNYGDTYVAEYIAGDEHRLQVVRPDGRFTTVPREQAVPSPGPRPETPELGPALTSMMRVARAREFIHQDRCLRPLDKDPHAAAGCVTMLGVSSLTVAEALDHADVHPRDAKGIRRIFHDAFCSSALDGGGCGDDHLAVYSDTARAVRRFTAQETR